MSYFIFVISPQGSVLNADLSYTEKIVDFNLKNAVSLKRRIKKIIKHLGCSLAWSYPFAFETLK